MNQTTSLAAIVNETLTGKFVMTAALKYLHEVTDAIFACQMQRAAVRIAARQKTFDRHAR
jgi:hypothetical protein